MISTTNLMSPAADSEVIRCGYCPRSVAFRPTYINGHALCFDAALIPRGHDREHHGWLPVLWPLGDELRVLWAPWRRVPAPERRRVTQVAVLHVCSGQTSAAREIA